MPGLAGLFSDSTEPTLFSSMQASMDHRNYSVKNYVSNGIHLSHVHINNAEKGIRNSANGKFTLAFHGVLFSFDQESLKESSDHATFFLNLIEQRGLSALAKVNGQFSASLYDHETNVSYLISDRFSTHPLYYTISNKRMLFASEVKALLKDNFNKTINYHGIAELFSFGHLFGNKTLFEDVHLLPPATLLKFEKGFITKSEYWSYPYSENTYAPQKYSDRKSKELATELGEILVNATRRQTIASDKLLLPLSGGLDSRYVAALYHHIGKNSIETFTMGPDESEDQIYATQVANALDFPHHRFNIKPEKTWDAASLFSYVSDGMSYLAGPLQIIDPLQHFASSKEFVSASQMCDALYGSTLWRNRIRTIQENKVSRHATDDILINLFNLYDQEQIKLLFHTEVYDKIKGLYREVPLTYCDRQFHPLHNYYRLLMNEHGRRGTLGGNLTMNMFYELRMISYDNDVFDFGLTLPIVYREHQYLYRKTFTQLFPALAKIKRQGYSLNIGASKTRYELKVLENKIATMAMKSPLRSVAKLYKPWSKPSYVNYKQWFRDQLRSDLVKFLTSGELKCAQIVRPDYVKTMVNDHINGKRDNTSLLWQVINLEFFYRNFIG